MDIKRKIISLMSEFTKQGKCPVNLWLSQDTLDTLNSQIKNNYGIVVDFDLKVQFLGLYIKEYPLKSTNIIELS